MADGLSASFGASSDPGRVALAVSLLLLVAVTIAAYLLAERVETAALIASTSHRQELYVANLESEMGRYETLPQVVGFDPRVLRLLADPDTEGAPAHKQVVNEQLQAVSELTGAAAIYVMNLHGLTLAASNWNLPSSFVDAQFAYRPYFQDAARGLQGRFYGVGTVSLEPGYYFADAVRDGGRIVGVAAVKVDLEKLEDKWARSGEHVVVVDGNGVVILSSEPQWRFKTLRSLSRETLGRLASTRQYWKPGSLAPLGLVDERDIDDSSAIFRVSPRAPAGVGLRDRDYLFHRSSIGGTDWQLFVMADVAPALATARLGAVLAALTLILVATVLLYLKQRSRVVAQGVAARAALQRANDRLEEKVRLRTEALSEANVQLHDEIGERRRAEETLRSTLSDLVQTAKMAVLGKMSTSITHELNQPLAALQTLSDNTTTLIERSMFDSAKENLRMISRTVAHMGQITGQLKKFARRSDVESEPVQLETVIADVLFLLGQSLRGRNIRLEAPPHAAGVRAMCNANRLGQVLVNLVSNAADAVEGREGAAIEITLREDADGAFIDVHDNGPGLDEGAAAHLFEPFFTTKDQGSGLGLGLAISNDIVRHFGGALSVDRSDALGGARFVIQLRLAPQHAFLD